MTYLDDRIIGLLADGEPRSYSDIYTALYGAPQTYQGKTHLTSRLGILRRDGAIAVRKVGRRNVYADSEDSLKDFLGVDFDPDILIGKAIDPMKDRKECVIDLLDDGEIRTARQLSRAYWSQIENNYTENYQEKTMWDSLSNLCKWGRVERINLCSGVTGWRAVA